MALADLATRLGYAVELGAAEDSEPRADDAAVVVASHGHDEERVLTAALRTGVPYVGWSPARFVATPSGSRSTCPTSCVAELHTPAGLEIGAETPEEIALAILAEIVALRRSGRRRAAPAAGRARPPSGAAARTQAPPRRSRPRLPRSRSAVDPVCGMEVAISAASIQLERDGERYYFCSEGCRDSFGAEGAAGGAAR